MNWPLALKGARLVSSTLNVPPYSNREEIRFFKTHPMFPFYSLYSTHNYFPIPVLLALNNCYFNIFKIKQSFLLCNTECTQIFDRIFVDNNSFQLSLDRIEKTFLAYLANFFV